MILLPADGERIFADPIFKSSLIMEDPSFTHEDIKPFINAAGDVYSTINKLVCEKLDISEGMPVKLVALGFVAYFLVMPGGIDLTIHSLSNSMFGTAR